VFILALFQSLYNSETASFSSKFFQARACRQGIIHRSYNQLQGSEYIPHRLLEEQARRVINRHRAVDLLVQLKFLHSICKKKFCGRGLSRVSPESCFIQLSDLVVKNKHIMSFMIQAPLYIPSPCGGILPIQQHLTCYPEMHRLAPL